MPGTTRIVPLGGLGEVGKNMTVYEADGERIVVDAGLAFPRDEHLGVDLILPDFSYLTESDRPIRAVLLTHGHEDHVGALPYLLREGRVQEVWATRLTLGLIKSKLDEHGLARAAELQEADPEGEPVRLGPFTVEFVRVAHSIPDAVSILIDSPGGRILHTGDYKIDHTPVDGLRTDVGRLADPGNRGVSVEAGDTVIISAKPVPGNELRVHDAINQLARLGAEVLHQEIAPVHVSGHGNSEELRTMLGLVRPKAVMPVHGEFRMLAAHARLAREGGVPEDRIVIAENGSVVELSDGVPRLVDHVAAGVTFVDGLGVGDVRDVALRDRRHLSEDGVLIVVATLTGTNGAVAGQPELIARGFAEPDAELLDEMRGEAQRVLAELIKDDVTEIKLLQEHLHDGLGQLVYDRTGRRPMILPVVVEV